MNALTFFTILSAFSICFILFTEVRNAFREFKGNSRFDITLKLGFLVLLGTLLALSWPGLVSGDDLYAIAATVGGNNLSYFSGGFYSGYIHLLTLLNADIYLSGVINLILYFSLFSKCFVLISVHSKERKLTQFFKVLSFLFFISPLALSFAIFQNRDALFSLLFSHIIFYLFISLTKGVSALSIKDNLIYFLSLCLFSLNLRQDALLNLTSIVFLIVLLRLVELRIQWKPLVVFLLMATTAQIVFVTSESSVATARIYQVTTVINPLSYIIHEHGLSALSNEEKNSIDVVFNISYLTDHYSALDIVPFHKGGLRSNISAQQFDTFFTTCIAIFWRFKLDFLQNRMNLFLHGTNIFKSAYLTSDSYLEFKKNEHKLADNQINNQRENFVYYFQGSAYRSAVQYRFLRIPFFSLTFHFLIFIFLIFNRKIFRSEFWIVTWIFLRLPGLFLLAPGGFFKYHYATYFCFVYVTIHLYFVGASQGFWQKKTRN